jgi:hypothetical protein
MSKNLSTLHVQGIFPKSLITYKPTPKRPKHGKKKKEGIYITRKTRKVK